MYILALLIHNGIQGNGGLAGLAVADDQLTLAPTDGHQSVDSLNTRLQGYGDALPVQHTGRRALHGPEAVVFDGSLAVYRAAQGVHHAAAHSLAHGHLNDVARPAHNIVLPNGGKLAQQHNAHIILLQVHDHAPDIACKFQHFPGHYIRQARHAANTVGHADDLTGLINVNGIVNAVEGTAHTLQRRPALPSRAVLCGIGHALQPIGGGAVIYRVSHAHTHTGNQALVHTAVQPNQMIALRRGSGCLLCLSGSISLFV